MSNIFNEYPYKNYNDFNLDYILRKLTEMDSRLAEYVKQSTISFHDPITWNITEQYTVNTMVVDSDGTAYLSVKAVPAGVDITNVEYWQPIFNYDDNINKLRATIAANERSSTTASDSRSVGDLVYLSDKIYKVVVPMNAGDAYIIGTNCVEYTVSDRIRDLLSLISANKDSINKEIEDRIKAVNAEKTERIEAVNAEKTERIEAVNAERRARELSDNSLDDKITAVQNNFKYDHVVSIEKFGAIAGGSLDDIIDNAIQYCKDNDCTLYIPGYGYTLTKSITIDRCIHIMGDIDRGLKGSNEDGRATAYSIIFNGSGYMFNISNTCAFSCFDSLSIKGNGSNKCFYVNSLGNLFENCEIRDFDTVLTLDRTSEEIPTFENIIRNNRFSNNKCVLACNYTNGTSSDGYFVDNIIISYNNLESYSINADYLSEWIISGNHDYSSHGIFVNHAVGNLIDGNYFDTGSNKSIELYIDGMNSIVNNKFLTTGGKTPDVLIIKIRISTKGSGGRILLDGNVMMDAEGVYTNGNVYMIDGNQDLVLGSNATNGTAKILSNDYVARADLIYTNATPIKIPIERYESKITYNKDASFITNGIVTIYEQFTVISTIIAWTDGIVGKLPIPSVLKGSNDTMYIPIYSTTGTVILGVMNNNGTIFTTANIEPGTYYISTSYSSDQHSII